MQKLPEFRSFLELVMGIQEPWHITGLNVDTENCQIDIDIDFMTGAAFTCPKCGQDECSVHDTRDKRWRHLNLFQYKVYVHARVPRIRCPQDGTHQVLLPWAREGSGFTLLFESLVMELAQVMPVKAMADMLGEHDTRLWRIINHHIAEAVNSQDLSNLESVGVDETARRKGHRYITSFIDLKTCAPVFVTEGKGKGTLKEFLEFIKSHGGAPSKIKDFSCDMSPAFIAGIGEYFPCARITFDKFHVIKMMNEALDNVRRKEQKEFEELKGSRWLWLRKEKNLKQSQKEKLNKLIGSKAAPQTTKAYGISQSLKRVYSSNEAEWAELALKGWYRWASHSRLKPVVEFARTVKEHWNGIINYFHSRWTNSILEALNSLFKAFSARARGYRTVRNAISAFYLACGKLKFDLPRLTPE
ncbi:MAG: ISL3 family transposase [Synergistaceae bacterium]|jgi:transposase|nr:ISL3 family transposase [Synergistaceae bacterium]